MYVFIMFLLSKTEHFLTPIEHLLDQNGYLWPKLDILAQIGHFSDISKKTDKWRSFRTYWKIVNMYSNHPLEAWNTVIRVLLVILTRLATFSRILGALENSIFTNIDLFFTNTKTKLKMDTTNKKKHTNLAKNMFLPIPGLEVQSIEKLVWLK